MYELQKLPLEKIVVRCLASLRLSSFLSLTLLLHAQVSNTIAQTEHMKQANGKLEVMDVSPVIAESIRRVSPHAQCPSRRVTDVVFLSPRRTTERVSVFCSRRYVERLVVRDAANPQGSRSCACRVEPVPSHRRTFMDNERMKYVLVGCGIRQLALADPFCPLSQLGRRERFLHYARVITRRVFF